MFIDCISQIRAIETNLRAFRCSFLNLILFLIGFFCDIAKKKYTKFGLNELNC